MHQAPARLHEQLPIVITPKSDSRTTRREYPRVICKNKTNNLGSDNSLV